MVEIITSIKVPDKFGNIGDIVLGYDNIEGYIEESPYFGAIIGRYGNRIANGKFSIDNVQYNLATNNNVNHLHGGYVGFDKVVWDVETFKNANEVGLDLTYLSKDGEEGYPGNMEVSVTYTLTNNNELIIGYEATTDKKTICNLTNHTYFNLKDAGASTILDHELTLIASKFTPIDETLIPTGVLQDLMNTPFDFTSPTKIGKTINDEDQQIKNGLGFDHNFVLDGDIGKMKLAARVFEETTGRVLEVFTEEPGIQFYSENFLDGTILGKNNTAYKYRNGFCLETQHFPDSPNQINFPSTLLKPGEVYKTKTIYKFSTL